MTGETIQHGILLRQVAKRVLAVLVTMVLLVALAIIVFQYGALNKSADGIMRSLERHYADKITLLEQDWQESAIRLHARVEFLQLFGQRPGDFAGAWADLRASLSQENHDLFPVILVTGADAQILFRYQTIQLSLPERFADAGGDGWYFDASAQRLFRWYAQPLWLGAAGKGRLLLFLAMDHGLLFRNAMPLADLFLLREGRVVASSLGVAGQAQPLEEDGFRWQRGVRIDQVSLAWGAAGAQTRLVIRHVSEPLFAPLELALGGLAALLVLALVSWGALGRWVLRLARRIVTLGQVSREFSEGYVLTADLRQRLGAVRYAAWDEVGAVAEAMQQLTRTVARRTRELEEHAQRLQEDEARYRTLTNSLLDAIVVFDADGRIDYANPVAQELFGQHPLVGRSVSGLFALRWLGDEGRDKLLRVAEGEKQEGVARRGVEEFPVEISLSRWRRGEQPFFTAAIRDISERRLLEARDLRAYVNRVAISALLEIGLEPLTLRRKLDVALDIILTVPWLAVQHKGSIFLIQEEGDHLELLVQKGLAPYQLHACQRIPVGYCLCGRAALGREIVFSDALDERHDVSYEGIREHGHYCVPILMRDRLLGVLNLYVDHGHRYDPEEEAFLATIANTLAGVIDRGMTEEHIHHVATHDGLTNLPNRTLFRELLEQELKRAARQHTVLAVGFFDLDRFKEVNDTLGHEGGDALLQVVAERTRHCLRESDTLARMGGDEFTLILPAIGDGENALLVAHKIVQALNQPFEILGQSCQIGASVGLSLFPAHGHTGEALLQTADQTMYAVKRRGRNNAALYDEAVGEGA